MIALRVARRACSSSATTAPLRLHDFSKTALAAGAGGGGLRLVTRVAIAPAEPLFAFTGVVQRRKGIYSIQVTISGLRFASPPWHGPWDPHRLFSS